jgi:hypothetical protein
MCHRPSPEWQRRMTGTWRLFLTLDYPCEVDVVCHSLHEMIERGKHAPRVHPIPVAWPRQWGRSNTFSLFHRTTRWEYSTVVRVSPSRLICEVDATRHILHRNDREGQPCTTALVFQRVSRRHIEPRQNFRSVEDGRPLPPDSHRTGVYMGASLYFMEMTEAISSRSKGRQRSKRPDESAGGKIYPRSAGRGGGLLPSQKCSGWVMPPAHSSNH